jgi:hypothetical protein
MPDDVPWRLLIITAASYQDADRWRPECHASTRRHGRRGLQRLIGKVENEDIFVSLVEVPGSIIHVFDPFARRRMWAAGIVAGRLQRGKVALPAMALPVVDNRLS